MKSKWLAAFFISISFSFMVQPAANAVSNQRHEWYFKKVGPEIPPTTEDHYLKLVNQYGSLFLGDPSKKDIYLTFDNGYENGYTDDVLDVLKAKQVPAAFFVTGHFLKTHPELVVRMVKEGHIVGNHSYHHPDMTTISDEKIRQELDMVKAKYEEITGRRDMYYVRPPRGVFSERTIAVSKAAGYTHVFWSLAFLDWQVNRQRGWQYSYNQTLKQIHPGCILLLHTVSSDNAQALGRIIDELKRKGYTFKSLNDLSKKVPPALKTP